MTCLTETLTIIPLDNEVRVAGRGEECILSLSAWAYIVRLENELMEKRTYELEFRL